MKSWDDVAKEIVARIDEYKIQRGRDSTRVRIAFKTLYNVRMQPHHLPLTDYDWNEIRRAFAMHEYAAIQADISSLGLVSIDKAASWTKIGIAAYGDIVGEN